MDLLEDLKMLLLNLNFLMIYTIHKILALLKNHLITLKIVFLNASFRSIVEFYLFIFFNNFFTTNNDGKFKP